MFCPGCKTLCDEDAIFCGNCGKQIVPLRAQGATVAEPIGNVRSEGLKQNTAHRNAIPRRPILQVPPSPQPTFLPPSSGMAQTPAPIQPDPTPPTASPFIKSALIFPSHKPNKYSLRNVFITILLFVLVVGASAGLIVRAHSKGDNVNIKGTVSGGAGASGLVSFSDSQNSQGLTNSLQLKINGLGVPPKHLRYYAWIINVASEKTLPLGMLVTQGQNFVLRFTDKANLLAEGSELEITQEQGDPMFPAGEVVLTGTLPPLALIHIKHLLLRFDITPGKIGLLVGLRNQARILNEQAQLLKSFSGQGQDKTVCAAQSIINVIEGINGKNAQPLADTCAAFNVTNVGDGFSLLNPRDPNDGYIVLSAEHASLAAIQTDATNTIRLHAQHVQIATANIRKWVTTIDNDARQLITQPDNTTLIPAIATLADHALNGFDSNDNGQIESIPGEAGAITAYNEGQLMAQLPLGM